MRVSSTVKCVCSGHEKLELVSWLVRCPRLPSCVSPLPIAVKHTSQRKPEEKSRQQRSGRATGSMIVVATSMEVHVEVDQEAERASCSHQRGSPSKPPSLSSFHTTAQQPNDPAFKRTTSSTQNIPNTSLWAFQPPTVPPLYREHGAGESIG